MIDNHWQTTNYPWQYPNGPTFKTPVYKDPDFQDLMTQVSPRDNQPVKQRLRGGLTEHQKPVAETEGVVELVVRKQRQLDFQEFVKQHELEQRKKQGDGIEEPTLELGAIMTDEPATAPESAPAKPTHTLPAERRERAPAPESEPSDTQTPVVGIRSGLSQYFKTGLIGLMGVLGAAAVAIGIWYFGRGIYDNLEYR